MEEVLKGGSVNRVVKVGDTVRRTKGPWSPAVHQLLIYLEEKGFKYAPKFLGIDESGREILEYIEGNGANWPWPEAIKSEKGLIEVATMLREYHEVIIGFKPESAEWRIGKKEIMPGQIVRHGDFGPWNTIWQKGKLAGLIDWDFAEPGEKIDNIFSTSRHLFPPSLP